MSSERNIKWRDRHIVYQRDGYKCINCGDNYDLTVDHIIPYSKGGKCDISNYQTLCFRCNLRKRDKSMQEFNYDNCKVNIVDTYGMPEDVYIKCLEVGEEILGLNFNTEKKGMKLFNKVVDMCNRDWGYELKAKEAQNGRA